VEFYNKYINIFVGWQHELNSYISTHIRAINDENSLSSSLLIIMIAFIYGLVHAIGPGHGKALVSLYFTSNKSDYKKAFKMGFGISVIHALSALVLTFGIYFILKTMFRKNFNEYSDIALQMSAVTIIVVGVYLIYEAFMSRKDKEKVLKKPIKSEVGVAVSAGIVPCPGVMTIVLFCVVLNKFLLGVLAAVSMSIGMGLTISLAGIFSIALNRKAGGFLNEKTYLLEMFGAILILCLGLFLFLFTLA